MALEHGVFAPIFPGIVVLYLKACPELNSKVHGSLNPSLTDLIESKEAASKELETMALSERIVDKTIPP